MTELHAEPCVFIVFGATGDLMRRKLLPALFELSERKASPGHSRILGVARDKTLTDDAFRDWAHQALLDAGISPKKNITRWCRESLGYQAVATGDAEEYKALEARIVAIEAEAKLPGNRVFYLALPPGAFPGTIEALGRAGLNRAPGWSRLVIEKPFGRDLESARALNVLVHQNFDESQVYRIDHYLGKETVQNLLAFRFGNALFESAWNRDHVRSVQITVAESLGLEGRAGYYEQAGVLRDMVQNHLTQLLTLTAMEVPAAFEADSIRFEKVKVLRSVSPIATGSVVWGQYTGGTVDDHHWPGYHKEPDVAPDSKTPTFMAARLSIENWRWQGVPFFLRTGKRLARRVTQIVIEFRRPPVALFRTINNCVPCTNVMTISLQPDEGFDLSFEVKTPGNRFELQTERMQFRYPKDFGALSAGYDTLLLDVMEGDQTLFVHAEETEASWRLYTPLLEAPPELHTYRAGSWGPAASADLASAAGTVWMTT